MTAALLAKDVHVCIADSNAIFLDLKHDRYIGLDAAQTGVLLEIMSGKSAADAHTAALVAHLLEQKLLTRDSRSGRALRLTKALAPRSALVGLDYDPPCQVRWHHAVALAAAYFEVTTSLRFRSLSATVATASARRLAGEERHDEPSDIDAVRHLVLAFRRLRPLFYRSSQSCLLDSLVLAAYLAKYRYFPRVVIGVMLGPFGGHCWVQYGTTVLNDRLEKVTVFTPIMSS